eukprot:TRINITY_DN4520_c1_g1_i1.p1 TRINITY_DN4520_c1_g1~~TRINITY_DN4520_c1_g1_i1.p1  ORF type:complete len:262 (+),score=42.73 TRINITY_DN4520_c1_g1_i1:1-786(+)
MCIRDRYQRRVRDINFVLMSVTAGSKLVQHAPGVFYADSSIKLFRYFNVPIRMSVVRLKNNDLWLHSPFHPAKSPLDEITQLGQVKNLVAPNLHHHLWAPKWKSQFPEAKLYGAPGLLKKKKDVQFDITFPVGSQGVTANKEDFPWIDEIDFIHVDGFPALSEVAFFHKTSKTLLLTDLAFNVKKDNLPLPLQLYLSLFLHREVSMTYPFKLTSYNKKKLKDNLDQLMSWDFQSIIMAHGEVVTSDAKDKFYKGTYSFFMN